jgi:hypothetical protein
MDDTSSLMVVQSDQSVMPPKWNANLFVLVKLYLEVLVHTNKMTMFLEKGFLFAKVWKLKNFFPIETLYHNMEEEAQHNNINLL